MAAETPVSKKAKEPYQAQHNQVYIMNLPEDSTDKTIEEHFGKIGPVKRVILIKDKETKKFKGFGYVHYALESDAATAVTTLDNTLFNGKSIVVKFAKSRAEEKEPLKRRPSAPELPKLDPSLISNEIKLAKPNTASRTVVITSIPAGTTHSKLEKKARKVGPIELLEYPIPNAPDTAYVLYKTMEQAVQACKKLDGQLMEGEASTQKLSARVFSTAKLRQFRLIVRNLPWNCTSENLQAMFIKYGKIYEVTLPPGKRAGSSAGFGFVNFTSQHDAEKAIREGNGQDIGGRKIAVDWAVAREQYQEAVAAQKANSSEAVTVSSSNADDAMDVDNGADAAAAESAEVAEAADDDAEVDDSDGNDGENNDDAEENEDEDSDADDGDAPEKETEEKNDKPKKQHATDVHLGKTLFVRNLAYSTTEETLREKFSTWGKLRYAVLVKNRATGEAMGTAFVQFTDPEAAEKCLEDAYASKAFKTARQRITARDNESDILLDGRRLIVTKAVTREQAGDFKTVGDDRQKKSDPRNLALADAGVVRRNDRDAAKLTPEELERRQRGEHQKKMKLANPNFHVSKTRLSIRNLPKEVDDATLRRVFADAVDDLKAKGISTKMAQVKVARDPNRDNKSRGFGFVEFESHAAALAAVKKINNNDKILPGGQRLIVEFAIENSLVLQKRAFRQQKARSQGKGDTSADAATGEAAPAVSKARQNTKKRARDESTSQAKSAPEPTEESKPAPKRLKTADGFRGRPRRDSQDDKNGPSVSLGGKTRKQRSAGAQKARTDENRLERLIDDYKKKFD